MKAGKRVAAVNLGLRRNAPALTIANMRHRKARIIVPENPSETIKIDCHAGYTPPMGEYVFWNAGPKRCARTMPDRAPVRSRKVDMSIRDQQRVHSGFGGKTTVGEVLDGAELTGKTAIVTGGYSGIGLELVCAMAKKGAKIIVPVRSLEKARESLAGIAGDIATRAMDLGDLASVRRFAQEVSDTTSRLDFLINNAGIMACPETRVGPGWEAQFGVNHMGHFALTRALWPLLTAMPGLRVVALSSTGHKRSDVLWDDIQFEKTPYDKWVAYGQAKTANALFANALSRRLRDSGGLAFSVHPGGIFTPLQRHLAKEEMIALGWLDENGELSELAKQGFKTPEQGCATTAWAASSSLLNGKPGVYCEDCDIAEPTDPESPFARFRGVEAHACNDEAAERLWEISEALLNAA